MPLSELWKRKLAAYLPEELSHSNPLLSNLGVESKLLKKAEAFALGTMSAVSGSGGKTSATVFRHPLCSKEHQVRFTEKSPQDAVLEKLVSANSGDEQALVWKLWRNVRDTCPEYSLAPAVAELPDFTIWNLCSAKSALVACAGDDGELHPAMLMFQLGPVQDFIAQARSTKDLWSGSYLLSWLIAHGIKAITDELGPEAIIFPNLCGNDLFDALNPILGNAKQNSNIDRKLTPTLPNRFLALVPEELAETLARKAELAIRNELKDIANGVWPWIASEMKASSNELMPNETLEQWHARWNQQVEAFLQLSWTYQPWLTREQCLVEVQKLPMNDESKLSSHIEEMLQMVQPGPFAEDARSGLLWAGHYALVDAKLSARRNTRDFAVWQVSDISESKLWKDSLSGKEEAIGNDNLWKYLVKKHDRIFTAKKHRYGAMNLIKRLWCNTIIADAPNNGDIRFLWNKLGVSKGDFAQNNRFENVQDIADSRDYFAVIAMDGDEMGKWISGAKTPLLADQMKTSAINGVTLGQRKRMLTPAYHLQFSEALSNFALYRVRGIVEDYDGQLIYAGGDDVLAMLPAVKAVACAQALQTEFCNEQGYFTSDSGAVRILPGNRSTVSCGIAIGYQKAPLQMIIREAHHAESFAKSKVNRNAVAFAVYKHSGETLQWGCHWQDAAMELMEKLTRLSHLSFF